MSGPALPPGAERLRRLEVSIADIDEAVEGLCHDLPQINDPGLRPRIVTFIEGARTTLDREKDDPGPEIADRLNELLNGVRALAIPARDPDLGPTPTLKALEQATGVIAIRLINALEAAAALGWKPKQPELPERLAATVSRDEAGTLLDRIADRLDAVNASLDQLVAASANAPRHQQGLVNFYAGSVRVELNLAKMELKIGEHSVDFAALLRAAEAIADFTTDFLATLRAWAQLVSAPLTQAAQAVRWRVRKVVSGVSTALRFVSRKRRAEAAASISADPYDPPAPADVEEKARDMILAGQAPPAAWRPFIHRLSFFRTGLDRLDLLAGLTGLQSLDLEGTQVGDLAVLAGLTGLQSLDLGFTQVSDLAGLAGLTGLQTLDLRGTQVSDLAGLAGLTGLQTLYLTDTQVSDLAALAGLTGLQSLDLEGTRVSDLSVLAGLTGLQYLDLGGTQVSDLAVLAGLTGLQFLSLMNCPITDLSPLARLSQLQSLDLDGTKVVDLSPLAGLSRLSHLDLSNTRITDVSVLAHLTALRIIGGPAGPSARTGRRRGRRG